MTTTDYIRSSLTVGDLVDLLGSDAVARANTLHALERVIAVAVEVLERDERAALGVRECAKDRDIDEANRRDGYWVARD